MMPWKGNRLWQIVYPIAMYYVLYNVFYTVLCYLFQSKASSLLLLGISSMLTIPFIYGMYKKAPVVRPQKQVEKDSIFIELGYILGIVVIGVVLNVVISHTPLMEISAGFAKSNETLQSGGVLTKVFANCICIPILEETLYRGIVCGQLKIWYKQNIAIIVSALLFGIMHFNLVQFLYAFLVGLALAFVFVKTNKLWVVIIGHALTNFVVIMCHI